MARSAPAIDPHRRPAPPPTALPFRVRTLGRIRDQPYHSTPGTHHRDAMLTVVLAGRGRYLWPGGSRSVVAGMIGLVLPPPESTPDTADGVGVLMAEPEDPYDHVYCRFAGAEAMAIARRVASDQQGAAFFTHHAWEPVVDVLLRAINRGPVTVRPDAGRMERADAVLAEVLTLLDAPPPSTTPTDRTTPPNANQLLAYLHDHVADPTDLDAMARHFGYSKSHLCRVARRALGQTIQRAWEHARLERARILLAQRELPITHVARRVGYPDPAYFANVFRRATGQPPSAFRDAMVGRGQVETGANHA